MARQATLAGRRDAAHVEWMRQFVEALDLDNLTLVCQDWGSLIGLRLAVENDHRFARIVLANGGLVTGDEELPRVFLLWRAFARYSPWFPIGRIVQSATLTKLPAEVVSAYDAPFPSRAYKAGARAFPRLVPATPPGLRTPLNVPRLCLFGTRALPPSVLFNPHSQAPQRLSSTGLCPACWPRVCKPAAACLSFSTPDTILFVRRTTKTLC